ncbi:MAG: IS21 family transposase, partial [Candidatus Obscuribacterales bacterium]|nr:IS21 family transposase [Candidatus Obscuribacterales bacterium]
MVPACFVLFSALLAILANFGVGFGVFGKLKLSRFLENGNPKVSTYRTPGIMVASPKVRARKPWVLMIDDDVWHAIRLLHYRQGKSKKWIAQEFGLSRNTVAKYLEQADPPAYTIRQPRAKPVADKWGEHVRLILAEDQDAPRKQKHTAKRIFDRLVSEHGYTGSERTIRNLVASLRQNGSSRSFVPLVFEPGKDAQVDFGEAYVDIDGVRTKLYGFEMRLNYSRRKFQMYFFSPNMESFLEAHVRAFEFFGGVPERISYDNLGLAVVSIGKGRNRKLTKSFKQLLGYYAFSANFCTPGKQGAHEKGGVESGIGYSRRNWMVPVPKCHSLDELNDVLLQKCRDDGTRTVAGQKQSIDEAFAIERTVLLPLPAAAFDTGVRKNACCVDAYQTVIFDGNRYSVPTQFV